MKTKLLSITLAVLLLISVFVPLTASAEETEPTSSDVIGANDFYVGELGEGCGLYYNFLPPPPWMEAFYYDYGKYRFINYYDDEERYSGFYTVKDGERMLLSAAIEKEYTTIDDIVALIKSKDIPNFNQNNLVDTTVENCMEPFKDYHFVQDDEPDTSTTPATELASDGKSKISADLAPYIEADGNAVLPVYIWLKSCINQSEIETFVYLNHEDAKTDADAFIKYYRQEVADRISARNQSFVDNNRELIENIRLRPDSADFIIADVYAYNIEQIAKDDMVTEISYFEDDIPQVESEPTDPTDSVTVEPTESTAPAEEQPLNFTFGYMPKSDYGYTVQCKCRFYNDDVDITVDMQKNWDGIFWADVPYEDISKNLIGTAEFITFSEDGTEKLDATEIKDIDASKLSGRITLAERKNNVEMFTIADKITERFGGGWDRLTEIGKVDEYRLLYNDPWAICCWELEFEFCGKYKFHEYGGQRGNYGSEDLGVFLVDDEYNVMNLEEAEEAGADFDKIVSLLRAYKDEREGFYYSFAIIDIEPETTNATEIVEPTTEKAEPTTAEPTTEKTEPTTAEPTTAEPTTEKAEPTTAETTNKPAATAETQPKTTAPATKVKSKIVKPAIKPNTLKVSVKKKTVKAKKLAKKAQKLKAVTIKNAVGKITCKLTSVPKKIKKFVKINKNGVITLKKGKYAKKIYKLKVRITAAGNKEYYAKTINKTVKFRIG